MRHALGGPEFAGLDGPWSPGLLVGNILSVSGQLPVDHRSGQVVSPEIAAQVAQCMRNIEEILQQGGGTLASLIKVTVYLLAYSDFPSMNAAYGLCFGSGAYPARSCITVADLPEIAGTKVRCIIDGLAIIDNL
jgi:2-iminobutanoate/2-iminopropanoate deaminase